MRNIGLGLMLALVTTFGAACGGVGNTAVYGVAPGAGVQVSGNEYGYIVTANGAGGWVVTMLGDPLGTHTFSGSVYVRRGTLSGGVTCSTCDASGIVSQDAYGIDFVADITGDALAGFEFNQVGATTADPIYLDALVDGYHTGPWDIYFASTDTGQIAVAGDNPVGFVSP